MLQKYIERIEQFSKIFLVIKWFYGHQAITDLEPEDFFFCGTVMEVLISYV